MTSSTLKAKYTATDLWLLFLVCAFPIHIWSFLMAFMDFSWVAERTQVWDAIGLVSYALVIALLESIGVFILVMLMGILTPRRWNSSRRVALLGVLFLILSVWAILGQVYFVAQWSLPQSLAGALAHSGHPVRILMAVLVLAIFLSLAIPSWRILKSERFVGIVLQAFERLAVLAAFYLLLDLIGIVIVVVRSITL